MEQLREIRQQQGLAVRELEAQGAELLPDRLEMRPFKFGGRGATNFKFGSFHFVLTPSGNFHF